MVRSEAFHQRGNATMVPAALLPTCSELVNAGILSMDSTGASPDGGNAKFELTDMGAKSLTCSVELIRPAPICALRTELPIQNWT
eukprot:4493261-Pyramimonas_sp.AAC.1